MFTSHCYIRLNNKQIIDALKSLGYNICECVYFEESRWIHLLNLDERYNGGAHGVGYFDELTYPEPGDVGRSLDNFARETYAIDCQDNIDLFLSLAAIKDDTPDKKKERTTLQKYGL